MVNILEEVKMYKIFKKYNDSIYIEVDSLTKYILEYIESSNYKYKNNIYLVIENSFNTTAVREGKVYCKVEHHRKQSITAEVLTGEKVEYDNVSKKKRSFSYVDGSSYMFMELENAEQYEIPTNKLE